MVYGVPDKRPFSVCPAVINSLYYSGKSIIVFMTGQLRKFAGSDFLCYF